MFPIKWTEEMSVGIEKIDEQHKKLFQTMLELQMAIDEKRHVEGFVSAFKNVFDYAKTHFALEESYFDKYDYPQKNVHVMNHRYFLDVLQQKYNRLQENPLTLSTELIAFMEIWFCGHIMVMDKEYEDFLKTCMAAGDRFLKKQPTQETPRVQQKNHSQNRLF